MGSSGYKNGEVQKGAIKLENKPLSLNANSNKSTYKSKPSPTGVVGPRRFSTGSVGSLSTKDTNDVSRRVRVAIRLRPRIAEEKIADDDFADCVELQPELKRLKLRRNNWDSDTYEFDEVFTEFASQKRVYEVVAKPVVESVLEGYNGTIMAYGQTGTGKTYTLGRLGEEDTADRGIMVRAMEDILAEFSPEFDSIYVSYLQLYMETIQDLLDPANNNLSITEDPKTGDVSLLGATLVEIIDQKNFMELLRFGEAHRFAANTKLNTESSRSHAILMVYIKRSVKGKPGKDSALHRENSNSSTMLKSLRAPLVRKGKLVIVDLAGSERIDKSGSEGNTLEEAKSINLSLSALGKCINALAENSPHVPVRDSKLTRLLRDSFGGTARTSLVVTIGPSPRHRGETSSTILFGQRAMKVQNMLKIKEDFDYKSLSRRLDIQLEKLIAEHERQQKLFHDEIERVTVEAQRHISEAETRYSEALEKEKLTYQKDIADSLEKMEEKSIKDQQKSLGGMAKHNSKDDGLVKTSIKEIVLSSVKKFPDLERLLHNETLLRISAEKEVNYLRNQLMQYKLSEDTRNSEILNLRKLFEDEAGQKQKLEEEIAALQSQLLRLTSEANETSRKIDRDGVEEATSDLDSLTSKVHDSRIRDTGGGTKLFEQVGLQKILSLIEAEDSDIRIHAVKVVANLAAEEVNQEKIVEAGGLTSLLMLLKNSKDETIHRVAAGAIANLAMNETNQELIMAQGGIGLLSIAANKADNPQTLRMIAGAIANLCGNDKLQMKLRAEGGLKALLGMVRCRHPDVLAQVARGIANFAKCESKASSQGIKNERSLLIKDGVLPWIVQNANNDVSPIRRNVELALCHLGQHDINSTDMINGGALWELVRISRECLRDDVKALARRVLTSTPAFQAELKRPTGYV